MTYSNANFTPGLKGYTDIKPFRFWCQKVLPLVYDDSLSYYELLCKVTDYINNIITDLSATEDNVGDLLTAYNQLQDYVNNYFTNLDVQEEINNKLDDLAEDGTLTRLISGYVQPFLDAFQEQMDSYEENLTENMNNYKTEMSENFNTLQDTTGVNLQTQNNKIAVLENRMDTFSSLTQGSTTGDAELQDIRVSYSGKTYPTAGDAVRSQVSNLNDAIEQIYSDNSIKANMIDGAISSFDTVEFTDYTADNDNRIYAGTSSLNTMTAVGVFNTGAIAFSKFDGISKLNVKFTNLLGSNQVFVLQRAGGACTGWQLTALPSSFITNRGTYYEINLDYLRTSTGTNAIASLGFNITFGTTKPITYPVNIIQSPKELEWLIVSHKNGRLPIIVDANGNGDYITIQEAVDVASNGDEILILPGEYVESVTVTDKYIYLHGLDPKTTKLVNHTGDYNTPPLWMCTGVVEGLTIFAEHIETVSPKRYSYGIHLDQKWSNDVNLRSFTIRNCIVKSDFAGPIGCGVIDGCKVTIENSIIISTGITSDAVTAFQIHGNEQGTGSAEFIVKNTILQAPTTSNARGMLFSNGGSSHNTGTTFDLLIINSVMTRFYNNCGDLLTINPMSYGNNVIPLNVAQEYESMT